MPPDFHWHSEAERRKPLFVEWVYFKFFSAEADGIIIYGAAWGMPGVLSAQIFEKGMAPVRVVRHDFGSAQVWRSASSYDCRIGGSSVVGHGGGHRIAGSVADGESQVTWDLDFQALAPPLSGFEGCFGLLPSSIGWKLIAPLASVSGTVTAGGRSMQIDGKGYVDTNYGRWLFAIDPATHWTWLLALEEQAGPPLAVVGMNIRSRPTLGALFLVAGQDVLRFSCGKRTFRHRELVRDGETGVPIPSLTAVEAADEAGHRLELTVVSQGAFVYRQAIPPREMRGPLPTPFEWALSESQVAVSGSLLVPGKESRPIAARGIQEYPVTRLAWSRAGR